MKAESILVGEGLYATESRVQMNEAKPFLSQQTELDHMAYENLSYPCYAPNPCLSLSKRT